MEEIIAFYKQQGAPSDQTALVALLRELQQENGGMIPSHLPAKLAQALGVKESYLLAVIGRIPSLHLGNEAVLELCAGPNCGKHAKLAALAESLCAESGVTLKFCPCMRLCGKGPNIKFNGQLYHKADEALLRRLMEEKR